MRDLINLIESRHDPVKDVADMLATAGYLEIGRGSWGAVFQRPFEPETVLKVFPDSDHAYADFVALTKAHTNKHLPVFTSDIQHISPGWQGVHMEALKPFSDWSEYAAKLVAETSDYIRCVAHNYRKGPSYESALEWLQESPELIEACELIATLLPRHELDIKGQNMMLRGRTVVFTDPIKSPILDEEVRDVDLWESVIDEDRINDAVWWLQRWISGSMNDPDWAEGEAETQMGFEESMAYIGKVVGNRRGAAKPVLWRCLSLPKKAAQQVIETQTLPSWGVPFQSFSGKRDEALAFMDGYLKRGHVWVLVSAKPDRDLIMWSMADLRASKNGKVGSYLLALDHWWDQDEVLVRVSEPLPLLSAEIVTR